jgi:carbonic anhydrase
MEYFSEDTLRQLLRSSLKTASLEKGGWKDTGEGPGSTEGEFINWLTISNQEESVRADVLRIRNHPLVPREIPIYGFLYDVKTGRLREVTGAMQIGKAAGR